MYLLSRHFEKLYMINQTSSTMRNSILVTSDLKSVILVDTRGEDNTMAIGKRGVLMSVLGTDICATEVPAELDDFVTGQTKPTKPFFEFNIADAARNQLCITYNDANNTVFIIGITDIIIEFSSPIEIPKENMRAVAVKLKERPEEGFSSKSVILARLETSGLSRVIRFYHLSNN